MGLLGGQVRETGEARLDFISLVVATHYSSIASFQWSEEYGLLLEGY